MTTSINRFGAERAQVQSCCEKWRLFDESDILPRKCVLKQYTLVLFVDI